MKPALTLEAFADWCEKQPADEVYDYSNPWGCAVSRYMHHIGLDWLKTDWWTAGERHASFSPTTFGALATRLRTALSEAVQP